MKINFNIIQQNKMSLINLKKQIINKTHQIRKNSNLKIFIKEFWKNTFCKVCLSKKKIRRNRLYFYYFFYF